MGTNFYARRIPTEEEWNAIQKAAEERQLEKVKELAAKANRRYHIGKRSAGWAFLFQAREECSFEDESNVPWEDSLDSLKEYLSRPDVEIEDEYGDKYTFAAFWDEIAPWLEVKDGYWSLETYYRDNPDKRPFYNDGSEKVKDGHRWCSVWFC